jgi:hypothetical protein
VFRVKTNLKETTGRGESFSTKRTARSVWI